MTQTEFIVIGILLEKLGGEARITPREIEQFSGWVHVYPEPDGGMILRGGSSNNVEPTMWGKR